MGCLSLRSFIRPFVRSSVIISSCSSALKRGGGGYIGFGLSVILSIRLVIIFSFPLNILNSFIDF